MKDNRLNLNSGSYMQFAPTVVSDAISIAATNTTTKAVDIPIGAYVTQVALLCTVRAGSADIDVGDGDDVDRYVDGVTAMTANNMIIAPNVASGTSGANEVGGRYYAASDTIDLITNTTGSLDDGVGSCRVLCWYYV